MKKLTVSTFLAGMSGALVLAAAVGLSPAKLASADDCFRADPTITMTSNSVQVGSPGTTITYTYDLTNNDSVGCYSSNFTLTSADGPAGFWVNVLPNVTVVNPGQTVSVSVDATPSDFQAPGGYLVTVNNVKHYNDPLSTEADYVLAANFIYKILGQQVDTVAPSVYVLSPSNGAVINRNSSVVITQEAYDNVGVTRLVYKVKNEVLCDGLAGSCTWHPTKKGAYTISVTAYDAAGNNSTASVSVTVK